MNNFIQNLEKFYNIGELKRPLAQVRGGLINKMWKLETSEGIFAIKELNPLNLQKGGVLQIYNESELIADKISCEGISAITAIRNKHNEYVSNFDNQFIMLFPWIEAYSVKVIKEIHIIKISNLLSRIHFLNLNNNIFPSYSIKPLDINKCVNLILKYEEKLKDGIVFHKFLEKIQNNSRKIEISLNKLSQNVLLSHRDLDSKNVLWKKSIPFIIDWESVGYINPVQELISAALDWSGESKGAFNKQLFNLFISEYNKNIKIDKEYVSSSFYAILNSRLKWLNFNIQRTLDEKLLDQDEYNLAQNEVINSVISIKDLSANIDNYIKEVFDLMGLS